ncbi:TrbI/VirB10 family protein [Sphingomonas sanguinis]|uniref:TrbI/VirB10 family protein n=1 Tax=Sphingomonas sanguinis TaxID=33051 RepID=UPI000736F02D|nr:TrbI/VirB10 family protein [Sphingomonas sanguinis]
MNPPLPPEQDPRPVVQLPRAGLPGIAIAGGAVLAAGLLFAVLDARRRADTAGPKVDAAQQVSAFPSPPGLSVPPEPRPTSGAPMVMVVPPPSAPMPLPLRSITPTQPMPPAIIAAPTQPVTVAVTPPPAPRERQAAPADEPQALIIDGGIERRPTATQNLASPQGNNQQRLALGPGLGGDTAPAQATSIRNRTMVMPTGTMIPAVLETPIDTARPGLVRAVVSGDARGFDGRRILVPRGSRLIGEYQADVRGGQNRVLVNWTRLIRPDGVSIALSSPAADELGGAGVPGKVHSFFLERFGAALLQSAMTVGVNLAARPGNGSVIVGLPSSQINNTIGQGLLPNDLRPKITVKQGAEINVFVARDLDFSVASTTP